MPVTLDLPEDVLARLRAEADRRGVSLDEVVSELASALPDGAGAPAESPKLGFVALGSSTDGRSAADADEMLAEGFAEQR